MPTLDQLFQQYRGIIKDGHWFAFGYKPNHDGYIRVRYGKKHVYLHRLAFCIVNNLDYDDKSFQINHKPECHHEACWNPEHLYKGDHADNMFDRTKRITHCPNGHEYNKVNPKHHKGCRLCLKDSNERAKQHRQDLHANS